MPLLTRSQPVTDPVVLSRRLIEARQNYQVERNEVIDLATQRQIAVRETITDLQQESSDLSTLIEDARKP